MNIEGVFRTTMVTLGLLKSYLNFLNFALQWRVTSEFQDI